MSVPPVYLPFCNNNVWFCTCNEFIGCSMKEIDFLKPPKFSTTYSNNGIYRRDNKTICEHTVVGHLDCCQAPTNMCYNGCLQENLNSSTLSYISNSLQASTRPLDSSIRPSSASSSRNFVTSITSITSSSVHSSVPTETVGQQTALLTAPIVPESTSTSSNAATVSESTSKSPNAAAIAGGVAGGIAGLALLIGLLAVCRRKIKSQHRTEKGRFSAWNSGQPRSMQPGSAELDEIKQGPSTTSSPLPPPSAPPSPLLSPLPPPPAYASYNSHGNGLAGSPDHLHPSSGSPYVSYDVPSPESPPSPPPLKTRLSQQSTSSYSDGQDVSPISPHYQDQPFDSPRSLRSSVYSEVSGGARHAHAM